MKKGQVLILGFSSFPGHAEQAFRFSDYFSNLKAQDEAYDPQVRLCAFDINKVREIILDARQEGRCDVIVAIGMALNTMLPKLYEEIGGSNTVFWGVIDPIKLGLARSLEIPGGFFSGATPALPCPKKQARAMQKLYPHITKMLLLYDPLSLDGLVKEFTVELIAELRKANFIIKDYEVLTSEEAITHVTNNIYGVDVILFPENCNMANCIGAKIAYLCSLTGCYYMTAGGIRTGAALSYTADTNEMFECTVNIIRTFWRDRKPMALQPIQRLSDNRRLVINRFMSQKMPPDFLTKLEKHDDIEIAYEWISCPISLTKQET